MGHMVIDRLFEVSFNEENGVIGMDVNFKVCGGNLSKGCFRGPVEVEV